MERRLAAILAADVVGYSRLMGEDEAGTLSALTRLRKESLEPLIAAHKGRVVKLMGDGFLVEFQSVVDAVACAVAWQESVEAVDNERPLRFRIGINLGDIIVEEGDIYGDGVNVAARLQEIADPGGICISGTVFEHIGARLDIAVDDLGARTLKNISKVVHVYGVRTGGRRGAHAARALGAPASPDRPSIAVLRFTNMSGDPGQDFFSDGITEDIITELSRFRSFFVIARNSSFAYAGRAMDLRQIGRELGVGYVAEGSVRRSGDRVRVTAQLIDARTGSHLWAERYDGDLKDVFSVQDEITRRIVASLAPRIEAEGLDLAKRKPPEDMRAYDYYLRAKALVFAFRDADELKLARDYCDQAIAVDPAYARAHACKSLSYAVGVYLIEPENLPEGRTQAMACAEKAVALDPTDGVCHWALGEAAFETKQYGLARDHMARALALNPNDADVLAVSGYINGATGDAEAGLRQMEMALERNPLSPSWYHWLRGIILFILGRFEEALLAFNLYGSPNASIHRWRAVTLMQLGRIGEARAAIQALLAMQPDMSATEATKDLDYLPDLAHHIEGLRQAGLPG